MSRIVGMSLLAGTLVVGASVGCAAQEEPEFLAVGEAAPDIQLVGGTRYGTLAEPVRLSDFRGETVVLAFFFRARTPG